MTVAGMTPEDALELARKMRMDITQLQARLSDLLEYIANDDRVAPPRYACDHCGIPFPSRLKLLDHAVLVHDDHEAEDEREAEWERLASLAQQSDPTTSQMRFEEDPERRAEIAADVRRRFCAEPEPATPDPEPPLGEPEPALA